MMAYGQKASSCDTLNTDIQRKRYRKINKLTREMREKQNKTKQKTNMIMNYSLPQVYFGKPQKRFVFHQTFCHGNDTRNNPRL